MHAAVRDIWISFNEPLEGRVRWMYLDVKGLVTVGVGNLVDPVEHAVNLAFVHDADDSPASQDEIRAAWSDLKGHAELAQRGHRACEQRNDLRLRDREVDDLVLGKLDANESVLRQRFPDFESWPADAQLGTLSMAWAMGPGFPRSWPNFSAAAAAQDWTSAATNCRISEAGNPGVAPRNNADVALFDNAGAVIPSGLDAATLYWPGRLDAVDTGLPEVTGLFPSTGSPDDVVAVIGTGFADASGVGFGGVDVADFAVEDDSRIVVTAPDGAGTVVVTVVNSAGESVPVSSLSEFTYV